MYTSLLGIRFSHFYFLLLHSKFFISTSSGSLVFLSLFSIKLFNSKSRNKGMNGKEVNRRAKIMTSVIVLPTDNVKSIDCKEFVFLSMMRVQLSFSFTLKYKENLVLTCIDIQEKSSTTLALLWT